MTPKQFYDTAVAAAACAGDKAGGGEAEIEVLQEILEEVVDDLGEDTLKRLSHHQAIAKHFQPTLETVKVGDKDIVFHIYPDRVEAVCDCTEYPGVAKFVVPMAQEEYEDLVGNPPRTRLVCKILSGRPAEVQELFMSGMTPAEFKLNSNRRDPQQILALEKLGYKFDLKFRSEIIPYELKCPLCGGGPEHFRFLEDIQNWRQVRGVEEGKVIVVEGLYQIGEGYDDGRNPIWECHNPETPNGECLHVWPIREEYELIDWR